MKVLIGHTGFVGGSLLRQTEFDETYNSKNIGQLSGKTADLIVCAGVPAQKWIANQQPERDLENINVLISVLKSVKAARLVLISTIDVYPDPSGGNEDTELSRSGGQAYGRNRLLLEDFVQDAFEHSLVIRLPALFGKGLKKNVIFDLLHDNCLENINPKSSFQWYDVDKLWKHIEFSVENNLSLVNLFTEPFSNEEIIGRWFSDKHVGGNCGQAAAYDLKTKYDGLFGGTDGYIQNAGDVLDELGRYIASERGQ